MSGRPVEAGDRVFGVAGESLRPGGHVLGAGSPKYEVLRSDQKVSYLAHLGVQRVIGVAVRTPLSGVTVSADRGLFPVAESRACA